MTAHRVTLHDELWSWRLDRTREGLEPLVDAIRNDVTAGEFGVRNRPDLLP